MKNRPIASRIVPWIAVGLMLLLDARAFAANIILLIGDGMGPEQVKAAAFYAHGTTGTLAMESMLVAGWIHTDSRATNQPTDSAAAATAMATGHKVDNGVLSLAIPGDGASLTTILELAKEAGWSAGLATTSDILDATPAAFAAHSDSRTSYSLIARQMLERSRPDVLLGGGNAAISVTTVTLSGYAAAADRDQMQALTGLPPATPVAGIFGKTSLPYEYDGLGDLPHLREMAAVAIQRLARNPNGFFVMIEGGRIDHVGHANDLARNIAETLEFDRTVQDMLDWAWAHPGTLVIVTADHETGGLTVTANNGAGNLPEVKWTTTGHTGIDVQVFAEGPNSDGLAGVHENTEIFEVMKRILNESIHGPSAVSPGVLRGYR